MRLRWLVFAQAVLAASLAHASATAAQPTQPGEARAPAGDPAPTEPSVVVTVMGDEAEAAQLERSLAELLGRLGVKMKMQPSGRGAPSPSPAAVALVRIDVSAADEAVITIVDPATGTPSVRRVPRRQASRRVLLEEAAHVVHGAVDSLLAARSAAAANAASAEAEAYGEVEPSEAAAPSLPEPPPAAPVAAPPRPTRTDGRRDRQLPVTASEPPSWGIDAAALLGGHGFSDSSGLVMGAGVAVASSYRRGAFRPGGWLTAEYRLPFDIEGSDASPSARVIALRTFPTIDLLAYESIALQLGVGGGLDIFSIHHRIEDSEGQPHGQRATKVTPILTSRLVLLVRLVDNVQLVALGGADFDFRRPGLDIRQSREGDHRPWLLRPTLQLGASFTLGGSQPFVEQQSSP